MTMFKGIGFAVAGLAGAAGIAVLVGSAFVTGVASEPHRLFKRWKGVKFTSLDLSIDSFIDELQGKMGAKPAPRSVSDPVAPPRASKGSRHRIDARLLSLENASKSSVPGNN